MIDIISSYVAGLDSAIHGMRNPMNSWGKSDSYMFHNRTSGECRYILGNNDKILALKLAKSGSVHAKYRRMIWAWCDITAPLYWWKEFETYRAGVIPNPFDIEINSCSTMHKLTAKEFEIGDFSNDYLTQDYQLTDDNVLSYSPYTILRSIIVDLNTLREKYVNTKDKKYWYAIVQLLPSSYNQKRTLMLNYEVLAHMYKDRKDHKLDEWRDLCKWIETLPYSELITLKENNNETGDK